MRLQETKDIRKGKEEIRWYRDDDVGFLQPKAQFNLSNKLKVEPILSEN